MRASDTERGDEAGCCVGVVEEGGAHAVLEGEFLWAALFLGGKEGGDGVCKMGFESIMIEDNRKRNIHWSI